MNPILRILVSLVFAVALIIATLAFVVGLNRLAELAGIGWLPGALSFVLLVTALSMFFWFRFDPKEKP